MLHVFLLIVLMDGKPISNDMYFYSIDRCNYFASKAVKTYGFSNVPDEHKRVAYCKPVVVNESKVTIYK